MSTVLARAATAVARTITRRATPTITKGWRDSGTHQPQSRYDLQIADHWAPAIAAALAALWPLAAILAAIRTALQHRPLPAGPALPGG